MITSIELYTSFRVCFGDIVQISRSQGHRKGKAASIYFLGWFLSHQVQTLCGCYLLGYIIMVMHKMHVMNFWLSVFKRIIEVFPDPAKTLTLAFPGRLIK